MSELRFNVVESAFYKKAATVGVPEGRPCDYFGKYVFGREQMFHYLSAETYASMGLNLIEKWPMKLLKECAVGQQSLALHIIHIGFSLLRTVQPKSTTLFSTLTAKEV